MIGPESHWERVGREAWNEPDVTQCQRCLDPVEAEEQEPLCPRCWHEQLEDDCEDCP